MRKLIIILFVVLAYSSCKKSLCTMQRWDVSMSYGVERADTNVFYFWAWEEPRPTDTNFKQEILDSMSKLRAQGFTLIKEGGIRYKYVECAACDELNRKKQSAKATCGETN